MKYDGTITFGNVLTIVLMAVALASGWMSMTAAIAQNTNDLEKHKAVDEVHDEYVKEELKEIKELLKQLAEE